MFSIDDISEWVGDTGDQRILDGDMTVSDEGSVVIAVDFSPQPNQLSISFTDPDPVPPPCGPFQPDICAISVVTMDNGYPGLSVYWRTQSQRALSWQAIGYVFSD